VDKVQQTDTAVKRHRALLQNWILSPQLKGKW